MQSLDDAVPYPGNSLNPPRPIGQSILRGLCCRCPACGVGRLFPRFLKLAPVCASCGEELYHARPDDAPPYFVILIVGHIVVPLMLVVEEVFAPALWVTSTVSVVAACLLAVALLPSTKGAIVGVQWANWMHGFDPRHHTEGERSSG
jgi:uncharacterized protein (DUF983 family)